MKSKRQEWAKLESRLSDVKLTLSEFMQTEWSLSYESALSEVFISYHKQKY